jgi:hypothetical protein
VLLLKLGLAAAMIRGLVSPMSNFKEIWQKRQNVQANRKVSDKDLFERGLLRKDIRPTIFDVRRKVLAFMNKD